MLGALQWSSLQFGSWGVATVAHGDANLNRESLLLLLQFTKGHLRDYSYIKSIALSLQVVKIEPKIKVNNE